MRTPGQFQQNFPRELAISEAAALAGADAIQFRIDHATEERVIGVLKAVREASGWETRPSPQPKPVSTGAAPVRGRGVSVMFRSGTYWACVCEIAVTPGTGAIAVEKYTIAVDPGIVVNPMQLKRQVEGGAVMGISHRAAGRGDFRRKRHHRPRLAHLSDPEDGRYSRDQGRAAQPARSRQPTAADRRRPMPSPRPPLPRHSSTQPERLPGGFRSSRNTCRRFLKPEPQRFGRDYRDLFSSEGFTFVFSRM